MKISEVGIDNGYAIVRGWVGSDGAATDVLIGGITDGATLTDPPSLLEFTDLVLDLGGGTTLVASSWKIPVRCATTTNGTLATAYAAGQVVDGITLATSDRVLLKNQTAPAENGIYTVNASGAPSRSLDLGLAALVPGAVIDVLAGTTLAATIWMCTNQTAPVLDTDPIAFAIVGGGAAGGITATDGVTTVDPASSLRTAIGGVADDGGGEARLRLLTDRYGGQDAIVTNAASGATATIDCAQGNVFDITLTASCTFSIANPPPVGVLGQILVVRRQGGSGSYLETWPANVKWQATDGTLTGTAPTLHTAVGAEDAALLGTVDGGVTWGATALAAGVTTLAALSDVSLSGLAAAQFLRYSGSVWVNAALIVSDYPYHSETLCDSSGPILQSNGDVITVVGVPN